jgi:hypothetical protein
MTVSILSSDYFRIGFPSLLGYTVKTVSAIIWRLKLSEKRKDTSGETTRSTYRIPPESIEKLDEIVAELRAEVGSATRTSAILYLISKEHAARKKRREQK